MAFKGGARKKATLAYHQDLYTPQGSQELSEKQIRQEYSRLRSIARKRLERFEGTEWTTTQIYKYNKQGYKPLKEIKSIRELRYELRDVARFIDSTRSSVSGLKQERTQAVETLNDRGYDFVTKKNHGEFIEFMEFVRQSNLGRLYDSERVADQFEEYEKEDKTKEEMREAFKQWSKDQKQQSKIKNKNKKGSDQYRKALD